MLKTGDMQADVTFIVDRFPTHRFKILDAYSHNEEFKSLCEDLYTSAKSLERYQYKRMHENKVELEYQRLYLELEKELLKYLTKT